MKGFLQRLHFFGDMKKNGFKPENTTLNRNFIAYKLGRISKKQINMMKKEREGAEVYMNHMSSNAKSAEALIEEFLPNVERIFRERTKQIANLKIKLDEKSGKRLDFRWQKVYEKATNRGD